MPSVLFLLTALSVLLANLLLFSVQPIVGRILTPLVGGSPLVWNSVLVFFQLMMVVCYGATWLCGRYIHDRRVQLVILAVTFAGALIGGPVRLPAAAIDLSATPGGLLMLLTSVLIVPMLPIGMTTSLLQMLTARALSDQSRGYSLSSLSNFGGLITILVFAVCADEFVGLEVLISGWTWTDTAYRLVLAGTLLGLFRQLPTGSSAALRVTTITGSQFLFWLFASAVGALILNVGTLQLGLLVPSVPFVWLPPLGLYLLTFSIVFHPKFRYRRPFWLSLMLLLLLASVYPVPGMHSVIWKLGFFFSFLFSAMMLAHAELSLRKPAPEASGVFFFATGLGGAIGGLTSQFVLPWLFSSFTDPVLVTLSLVFLLLLRMVKPAENPRQRAFFVGSAAILILTAAVALDRSFNSGLDVRRNFFGITKVRDIEQKGQRIRAMVHNSTYHGMEVLDGSVIPRPVSYYHEKSGLGQVFQELGRRPEMRLSTESPSQPLRVAAVGLGAGAVSAYLMPSDEIVYFEINPVVKDLAREWFRYISTSQAKHEFVDGDARQTLSTYSAPAFDVLVLDAFSGGSPPLHLLTAEAFALYRARLKPDGILIAHISNSFFDLTPVFREYADLHGFRLSLMEVGDGGVPGLQPSRYVAVYFSPDMKQEDAVSTWTDNYFPLLRLLQSSSH